MRLLKVAAATLNQTPLDWSGNRANIFGAIAAAREQGVSLLCLPELCITGYGCEDAFHSSDVARQSQRILNDLLPQTAGMIVSVGFPMLHRNGLLNVNALICDGTIAGLVAKRHLAGDGIHYEPRWFKPWPAGAVGEAQIGGRNCPLGDLIFECDGIRIGFEICEDAWVADRPGRGLSLDGADVIFNPSASHFAFGKMDVRRRLVLEGSRAFGVTYVYANLLGDEAGRAIYDGGALIASAGKMLAEGPRFSFRDFNLTSAVVDLDSTRTAQARSASFSPAYGAPSHHVVKTNVAVPTAKLEALAAAPATWERGQYIKEEEFLRAEALGLWDYLRKSRSEGFVVSLSGGADSTLVACLVATMLRLVHDEIGLEKLLERLAFSKRLGGATSLAQLTSHMLTCVYLSTRNSSDTTRHAAQAVADALGATFVNLDVDAISHAYVQLVSLALDRPLDWTTDDIALQNIQARTRSPGVWMIANIKNALLLATSNRSEAAVGYATMDGDTSGGLSPIAGIDKAFIRHWLVWMEKIGPAGLTPLRVLESVNVQAPTAELRPAEKHQTDEDDLMPYVLLDAVEKSAIRDKQSPVEVYQLMRIKFPDYSIDQLATWVDRFFRLWCRNQWKRERYAPSFHLDDENLDPKTWCRFPILSGGFRTELEQLKKYVASERAAAGREACK